MNSRALLVLERRRQQVLWTAPVWIMSAGVAAALCLALSGAEARLRMWPLGISVVVALIIRLVRRPTLREVTHALEMEMGSRNRLEALVELAGRSDPLAQALSADAGRFLVRHPLPRPYAWMAGVGVMSALVLSNVLISLSSDAPPPIVSAATAHRTVVPSFPVERPIEPMTIPPASLRWISSVDEMAVGPTDDTPLIAEAESVTGLRTVALEVFLEGESPDARLVADDVAPGVQTLTTTLRLAASDPATSTWAAYYLKAERVRPPDLPVETVWPPVVSPLQVVRWGAAADSIATDPDDPDPAAGWVDGLRKLQRDQRQALRETFALRHGLELSNEADARVSPAGVRARQEDIAANLSDLGSRVSPEVLSAKGGEEFEQAVQQSQRAIKALALETWDAGMKEQLRSLASLAAAEIGATQAWRERQARRAAEEAERLARLMKSFGDELPARAETPAGRLETLAQEQAAIADRLEKKAEGAGIFSAQDSVVRALASVMTEETLPAALNDLLAEAMEAAKEARKQLNENDRLAATEPSARAAQALTAAVEQLDEIGRDRATEDLLAAQSDFVRSAFDVQAAGDSTFAETAQAAAEKIRQRQEQLRRAAQREQNAGSEMAAERLEELAHSISECAVCEQLGGAGGQGGEGTGDERKETTEKLERLAEQAAASAREIGDESKLQRRIAGDLEAMRRQLDEPALTPKVLREIRQELEVNRQRVGQQQHSMPPPPGPGAPSNVLDDYRATLRTRVTGLLALASPNAPAGDRQQTLVRANPAEAPPAYRDAVADYFESLARFRNTTSRSGFPTPSPLRSND